MSKGQLRAPVLITGAASGIGAETACLLSAPDQPLLLTDRDETRLRQLADSLTGPVQVRGIDVSDAGAWSGLPEASGMGTLSGAVLCAGVSRAGLISEMTFEDWRAVLSVNLDGVFLSLKFALPRLDEGSAVVVVSSATARKPVAQTAAYGASKAGLEQLVRVAALEAAPRGIRVNAVAPGGVKTPMFSSQDGFAALVKEVGSEEAAWAAMAEGTPLGRFAEASEVARTAAWLLSDAAGLTTGSVVDMDGGYGL